MNAAPLLGAQGWLIRFQPRGFQDGLGLNEAYDQDGAGCGYSALFFSVLALSN